ncbi:MAG: hypothetical protein GX102_01720 [Porphyromonadaceae bacterium]|nr:hypothetical protein [Porphyromonadaceae bacterium]
MKTGFIPVPTDKYYINEKQEVQSTGGQEINLWFMNEKMLKVYRSWKITFSQKPITFSAKLIIFSIYLV